MIFFDCLFSLFRYLDLPKLLFARNNFSYGYCRGVVSLAGSSRGVFDLLLGWIVSYLFSMKEMHLGVLLLLLFLLILAVDLFSLREGLINLFKKSSLFFLESSIILVMP